MRKAQIEIMGLVIIVILVTIGLFFSVAFRSTPDEKPPVVVYSSEELAGNFLITLLESRSDCGPSFRELAIDCIRTDFTSLPSPYTCGFDSCSYVEDEVAFILEETLDLWGYNYNLTYSYKDGTNEDVMFTAGPGTCNRFVETVGAPGLQPISLYRIAPGSAVFELILCV